MGIYEQRWFEYLNAKLDLILHRLENPDPATLAQLKGHIDARAAQLKAAVDAAQQPPEVTAT